jgi:hypothetical protein
MKQSLSKINQMYYKQELIKIKTGMAVRISITSMMEVIPIKSTSWRKTS